MIKIEVDISYPGLTQAQEEALREHIRRNLQPALATICCGHFIVDGTDDLRPVRSSALKINGSIKIEEGEAQDDRIRVVDANSRPSNGA